MVQLDLQEVVECCFIIFVKQHACLRVIEKPTLYLETCNIYHLLQGNCRSGARISLCYKCSEFVLAY